MIIVAADRQSRR